jgi:hypothetical protein
MKRAVLIICLLALALDLACDGGLGKTHFFAPPSHVKSLTHASPYFGGNTLNNLGKLPTTTAARPFAFYTSRYAITLTQHSHNRVYSYHHSSSGGIPL